MENPAHWTEEQKQLDNLLYQDCTEDLMLKSVVEFMQKNNRNISVDSLKNEFKEFHNSDVVGCSLSRTLLKKYPPNKGSVQMLVSEKSDEQGPRQSIRYVRFRTKNGDGFAVFGFLWIKSGEGDNRVLDVTLGASFCSPKDEFRKATGRVRALGRMVSKSSFKFKVSTSQSPYVTNVDFTGMMLHLFAEQSDLLPNWARKAFDMGNYAFGMSLVGKLDSSKQQVTTQSAA